MAKKKISYTNDNRETKRIISVSALNEGQKTALKTFADPNNVVTILHGCAGTGKTFLAVSWGLEMLRKGKFKRLIVTRNAVEAGEKLGSMPGNSDLKLQPYLIGVFDTLAEHLSTNEIKKMVEENTIVTLPVAFMRGVTFKDAFVVLDEAQNATSKQLHMFLTRIGRGSKVVTFTRRFWLGYC